ncbi:MAG: hypothetical protein HDQ88_10205 [Clostridia bacterium]|nr:hypothetical protein [Clostridia bacterium]
MARKIHETLWSPFDPEWYPKAFDKYPSTADELFSMDSIAEAGYWIGDSDGSKSSVFRNNAVTNNSFNEEVLKDTLFSIYHDSTHPLIASNHDTCNFHQWHFSMDDVDYEKRTPHCTYRIPIDDFLAPSEKEIFKPVMKQWISMTDLLTQWKTFKCFPMVFVNGRVDSEYDVLIDEREVILRLRYEEIWKKKNFRVDVYKFNTEASTRIMISRDLCEREWNWKIPVSEIVDTRILSADKVVGFINRIADEEIRKYEMTSVEFLGRNIEFLPIHDGYIDLTGISELNQNYIRSESKDYLWLSLLVPKFFHEFPAPLPCDLVYRPYIADFREVKVNERGQHKQVVTDRYDDQRRKLYVDLNGAIKENPNAWQKMIRPMILTDSFNDYITEDYDDIIADSDKLREVVMETADLLDDFDNFIKNTTTTTDLYGRMIVQIREQFATLFKADHDFMDKYFMEYDAEFDTLYTRFQKIVDEVEKLGYNAFYFYEETATPNDFWYIGHQLINSVRDLGESYNYMRILRAMDSHVRTPWEDYLPNKLRFQRPIDVSDVWTFELDQDTMTWYPYDMDVKYVYPDVYLLSDPSGAPITNRIFKAFFFYTDDINVTEPSKDMEPASVDWGDDVHAYYFNQRGTYKDIFMEKFYWMGIREIYQGMLHYNARWEVIEYIIDNPSYERFNKLFMETSDPYFKMGMANYLKSEQNNFPFDYDVEKMREAISQDFLGYQRVTNFEQYLQRSWAPQYFDFLIKIVNGASYETRLLKRPNSSFDPDRFLPILKKAQDDAHHAVNDFLSLDEWIIDNLEKHSYQLSIENFTDLSTKCVEADENMSEALKKTLNLDMEIFSNDDINSISKRLSDHLGYVINITDLLHVIWNDYQEHYVADKKAEYLKKMGEEIFKAPQIINDLLKLISTFNTNDFMEAVNNLKTYTMVNKVNPDDESLLYLVNKFNYPWDNTVQEYRNKLFIDCVNLIDYAQIGKSYTTEEIYEISSRMDIVIEAIEWLGNAIIDYWKRKNIPRDEEMIDALYDARSKVLRWQSEMMAYKIKRDELEAILFYVYEATNEMRQWIGDEYEEGLCDILVEAMEKILYDASYILGGTDKADAMERYSETRQALASWTEFVVHEQEVFDKIKDLAEFPNEKIDSINESKEWINACINYMDYVNDPYILSKELPSYGDVYMADTFEMTDGGFMHQQGDFIAIPGMGVCQVMDVDGTINSCASIAGISGYHNMTFINPEWKQNKYDSITSGDGMGIRFVPIEVSSHRIINDHVITNIVQGAQVITDMVEKSLKIPSKSDNGPLNRVLTNTMMIMDRWKDLSTVYIPYMSEPVVKWMGKLMTALDKLDSMCQPFMEARQAIMFAEYITDVWGYVTSLYSYTDKHDLVDSTFMSYYNGIKELHDKIKIFYSDGNGWKDTDKLHSLIKDMNNRLGNIHRYALRNVADTDPDKIRLKGEKDTALEEGDDVRYSVEALPNYSKGALQTINELYQLFSSCPTLQEEKWYHISEINVCANNFGFNERDIVEIEMPNGRKLVFIVDTIQDGEVTKLKPLMEYALEEDISNVYECTVVKGVGKELKIDILCEEAHLYDDLELENKSSDLITYNPFDENDMLMFNFNNIHDLDISYDVFLGGKPITDFVVRHRKSDDPDMPSEFDTIYINANNVIKLRESVLHIPGEDYFVYQVNTAEVNDPGAGYAENQTVYVDCGENIIKLDIDKLDGSPTKGIGSFYLDDNALTFNGENPTSQSAKVIPDTFNNIDDEYNDDSRNEQYEHPIIDYPITTGKTINGLPFDDDHWNATLIPTIPHIGGISTDDQMIPPGTEYNWTFHEIKRLRIHNSIDELNDNVVKKFDHSLINEAMTKGPHNVYRASKLPKLLMDLPNMEINDWVIVEEDENYEEHRMAYRVRSFLRGGQIVYDKPEIADYKWTSVLVEWTNIDAYPLLPTEKGLYPTAPWSNPLYRDAQEYIDDKPESVRYSNALLNNHAYIADLKISDIAVFNWSKMEWEDMTSHKWELITDPSGFTLNYLEDGTFSYDMSIFLIKSPDAQLRTSTEKRDATVSITAGISDYVVKGTVSKKVAMRDGVQIRKNFPYYQKEYYTIGRLKDGSLTYEMEFKLSEYLHYRNEIHVEDLVIFNKTANRFEDVLDPTLFDVQIKDPKSVSRGYETNMKVDRSFFTSIDETLRPGDLYGYNEEYGTYIFGHTVTDNSGKLITSLVVDNVINPPEESMRMEFNVYQNDTQLEDERSIAIVDFIKEKELVAGDGWIHHVTSRYAPISDTVKIIPQYDLDEETEYEIYIDLRPKTFVFTRDRFITAPTICLENEYIRADHMYILSSEGRLPLTNPSTGKLMFEVSYEGRNTYVKFLGLYKIFERLEIHTTPYPMNSVYSLRNIPSHGYINVEGKLNKPLNRNFYEFWVNGRLLNEEVTIITPTKLILHGLTSLKNFEIIEINRDPHEFFADNFVGLKDTVYGCKVPTWNYRTYLDDALDGTLKGDNYTAEEQEYLLTPVWRQVSSKHPEYENYPPNTDTETDVLNRNSSRSLKGLAEPNYEYILTDVPTIEKAPITGNVKFEHFRFLPIDDATIVNIINGEWQEEITTNPNLGNLTVMSDHDWYGIAAQLYDEFGNVVDNLDDAVYIIRDQEHMIWINSRTKRINIIKG